ncbi:hypothetical protein Acr_09g0010530 [Actinidia rufa]|uniref:Transmembrane protein n=1 Tax=Actinidia rufa TaxID=165716 RepID=A0A7J0F9P2_9ERIC|nr:hypothetical protein Acr_09g0010530 [Actinidia rufa]
MDRNQLLEWALVQKKPKQRQETERWNGCTQRGEGQSGNMGGQGRLWPPSPPHLSHCLPFSPLSSSCCVSLQYTKYKANIQQSMINFQLVLFLLPVLLIFVLISGFTSGRFNFRALRPYHDSTHQSGGSPWAVAILVMVLLVLVSYQSSFHSKWLGYV